MNINNTDITFNELRNIVALKDVRNFSLAAVKQHLTQPTLTTSLQNFESKLGVWIIDRDNRQYNGVTPEGRAIIEDACCIVNQLQGLHLGISRRMLSYVVAVNEERGFRKAASKCGVKQSTISAQIQKTEFLFDYKIFERPKKGSNRIVATSDGEKFIKFSMALVLDLNEFEKSYRRVAHNLKTEECL